MGRQFSWTKPFDWMVTRKWCEDCGMAVDAIVEFNPEIGEEVFCPKDSSHDLVNVKHCHTEGCDEDISEYDTFCKWCMGELKTAARRFSGMLPYGMDIDEAIMIADENSLWEVQNDAV